MVIDDMPYPILPVFERARPGKHVSAVLMAALAALGSDVLMGSLNGNIRRNFDNYEEKVRPPKPVGKGGTNRQKRARQGKNW